MHYQVWGTTKPSQGSSRLKKTKQSQECKLNRISCDDDSLYTISHNLAISFRPGGRTVANCTWEAWPSDAAALLVGTNDKSTLDAIQRAALTEGICVPHSSRSRVHIFSSQQAIQCLSPDHQNNKPIRLVISGDSYNRQLFISLADILLGNPSNERRTTTKSIRHS